MEKWHAKYNDALNTIAQRDDTIRTLDSVNLKLKNEILRLEHELKIRIDVEI